MRVPLPFHMELRMLSVFSKVRQTKRLRGLLISLVSQGRENQYDNRNHVRQHLVQLLYGKIHTGGDVHMKNIETTKEIGG